MQSNKFGHAVIKLAFFAAILFTANQGIQIVIARSQFDAIVSTIVGTNMGGDDYTSSNIRANNRIFKKIGIKVDEAPDGSLVFETIWSENGILFEPSTDNAGQSDGFSLPFVPTSTIVCDSILSYGMPESYAVIRNYSKRIAENRELQSNVNVASACKNHPTLSFYFR